MQEPKVEITTEEHERFAKAFKDETFRNLFKEYLNEISDEKVRKENADAIANAEANVTKSNIKKSSAAAKSAETVKTSETAPNYSFTHQGIVDYANLTNARIKQNAPDAIIFKCQLPLLSSISGLDLDIDTNSISLFKQGLYKLNVTLPFPVFEDQGTAKFDKSKKELIVVLPVRKSDCVTEEELFQTPLVEQITTEIDEKSNDPILQENEPVSILIAKEIESTTSFITEITDDIEFNNSQEFINTKNFNSFRQSKSTINLVFNLTIPIDSRLLIVTQTSPVVDMSYMTQSIKLSFPIDIISFRVKVTEYSTLVLILEKGIESEVEYFDLNNVRFYFSTMKNLDLLVESLEKRTEIANQTSSLVDDLNELSIKENAIPIDADLVDDSNELSIKENASPVDADLVDDLNELSIKSEVIEVEKVLNGDEKDSSEDVRVVKEVLSNSHILAYENEY